MYNEEKKNLIVKDSRNGKGIFGKKDFEIDDIIFQVTGKLIAGDEDDDIDDETRDNTYRYNTDTYISPKGRIGDMLNHSCNPNAKVTKEGDRLLIRAIKNIIIGKEITIDYSTIIAADDIWVMECNCGSTKCRGKIGKFKLLPIAIKNKYITENIVPEYIVQIS